MENQISTDDLVRGRKETIDLPDVLGNAGNADAWMNCRRPELISYLEKNLFGKMPPRPERVIFQTVRTVKGVFGGLGERRDVTIRLEHHGKVHEAHALWYMPSEGENIPLVVGLNFKGNAACTDEPDVALGPGEERGIQAHRWQIPYLLKEGFSLITSPRNDFFPDEEGKRTESLWKLFFSEEELLGPSARNCTCISAWAAGYTFLLELGMTDPRIDARCIWAHGHSRLGKTALWCGAQEPRFAGIVSNCSGCSGAALNREKIPEAEHIFNIATVVPRWFPAAYDQWIGKDDETPFDQHFLAALTAPRPLLVASATEDLWADPFNEYRCVRALNPVYALFGAKGIGDQHFPKPEEPLFGERTGYYLRTGIHDVTATDWKFVLEFIRKNR